MKYTDSKVKAKKTYYYKVQAYRSINGKVYKSKFSSIKKVVVK